jgi:hypothetical protein
MQPELEFYSTSELIDELMRRRTFLGVIIHSAEEFKQPQRDEDRVFRVHFNGNLNSTQAGRLLEKVASRIDTKCE